MKFFSKNFLQKKVEFSKLKLDPIIWEIIKKGIVTFFVRRFLGWAGGFLLLFGLTDNDIYIIFFAIMTSLIDFVWSFITKIKDLKTETRNKL